MSVRRHTAAIGKLCRRSKGYVMSTPSSDSKTNPGSQLNPGDEAAPGTPGTGEDICPECHGSGKLQGGITCRNCGGSGHVIEGIGGG
jgi:DnaJ-class molecular chaperone